MPDTVPSPEELLMRTAADRWMDDVSAGAPPFEPVHGLNLVVAPGSATRAAGPLAAARGFNDRVFFHDTGLGQDCRDPNLFLWRLLTALRREFEFAEPVPADPAAMRETLPNWLARAAAGGGIAIVIAGAHELSTDGLTADLEWLPSWLPHGVALLVSALPGPASEQFRERSDAVFTLADDDARAATESPLPEELLESDSGGRMLALLWISRAGLGAETLATVAQAPLPPIDAGTPGLFVRDGHIALASARARDAVARRWLGDHGRRQQLHVALARHFSETQDAESLRLACWHWAAAGRGDRLQEILVAPCLLEGVGEPSLAFEALRHWHALGGSEPMSARLDEACRTPGQSARAVLGAARLFAVASAGDVPVTWLRTALERAEAESDAQALGEALQQLAAHPDTAPDEARALLERALSLAERDGESTVARTRLHHRLARLFEAGNRLTEAAEQYQQGIALVEADAGQESPALIAWLNNLAGLHKASGDLGSADAAASRALQIARIRLGARHPTTASCCDQLAGIAYLNAQYGDAEPLYREALEITEGAFGPRHPATAACLGNLGIVLDARRSFGEAEQCHRRSLSLLMSVHGEVHEDTAVCMHNLAVTLESLAKLPEAEQLYRRALESWNEIAGEKSPAFATTLLHLAGVLRERRAWGEAEALYRSDIELWRELVGANHPHTLGALTELARLYIEGGKAEMAEPLLLHVKDESAQRIGKHSQSYLEVVALLARAYQELGEYAEGRALIEDALAACEGTLNMLSAPVQKLRKLLETIDQTAAGRGAIDV